MNIQHLSEEDFNRIKSFRHDIHQNPERSREEYRTTEAIKTFLSDLPSCRILDLPVKTGVLAQIPGTGPGEIMLRADIDALPQTERVDIPWKSCVPGVMHACGHDLTPLPSAERLFC